VRTARTNGQEARTRGQDLDYRRRHNTAAAKRADFNINQGSDMLAETKPIMQEELNAPFAGLKTRQQAAWASGDYAVVGTTLQIVGEMLAEACDIGWDQRVLDVAAGNGNATLAAARRGAVVTSTDYVGSLLSRGAERARAEGLEVTFEVADAEALPFDGGSFDAVLSTFGVMFTPDQRKAAAELLRVCRPGGRIGLANWTPDGFIGQLFKVLGRRVPPAPGTSPPSLWGVESHLQSLFGAGAGGIAVTRRLFNFRYRSAAHFIEVFRRWYGPVHKAFAALPAAEAQGLEADLTDLLERLNTGGKGSLVVPSEYLEIVVSRA
jgi:SAM-dependent methyltransferase